MEARLKELRVPLETDLRLKLEERQKLHVETYGKKPTLPSLLQEMALIGIESQEEEAKVFSFPESNQDINSLHERIAELEESEANLKKKNKKLKMAKEELQAEIEALKSAKKELGLQEWLMILVPAALALWQTYQLNQKENQTAAFVLELSKKLRDVDIPVEKKAELYKNIIPFISTMPIPVQEAVSKVLKAQ